MTREEIHKLPWKAQEYINKLERKLTVVVGRSEQLVCDKKCEWTRYPKDGIWYDGCVKCGKEVAN